MCIKLFYKVESNGIFKIELDPQMYMTLFVKACREIYLCQDHICRCVRFNFFLFFSDHSNKSLFTYIFFFTYIIS